MGIIKISNIKIYAYHGCLDEEGKIGSDYRVDLSVKANLLNSSKTDMLSDTVNYVHLNEIIREEMAIRSKLLETVASRILNRVIKDIPLVSSAKINVSKLNPPIGGNVAMVTVTMKKSRNK